MLVTISGIVGSGKTTIAKHVAEGLRGDGGDPVEIWNFRSLECFEWLRDRTTRTTEVVDGREASVRGVDYTPRTLTASLTAGYVLRILSFRWYRFRHRGRHHICNRYFYDNFAHFELRTRGERFWARLLRALIPRPDLAILLTAASDTIAQRRRRYSQDYLSPVAAAYTRLPRLFPEVRIIATDSETAFARARELAGALRDG